MHRKPEPKAAAHLLTQAFAAQGITLKHQAALNLLATLEGFESYAHMKAVPHSVDLARVPSEKHVVHLLFSEEYVRNLSAARSEEDEATIEDILSEAKAYEFDTERELCIFLEGVDAGCGWLEYENVTSEISDSQKTQ